MLISAGEARYPAVPYINSQIRRGKRHAVFRLNGSLEPGGLGIQGTGAKLMLSE